MIPQVEVWLAGLLSFGLVGAAKAQEAQEGPAVVTPQPLPARPPDTPVRAQRLQRIQAELEQELAKIEKFGHLDDFMTAVCARPGNRSDLRWLPVKDGWVPILTLQRYEAWNSPAPGRTLLTAVDHELEGHPYWAIVDFDRQLRAHGVQLLVVTIPMRIHLYPELLIEMPSMEGFAGMSPGTTRFSIDLCKAGVEVLNLTPVLSASREGAHADPRDHLYLRSNQHWAPRAAEIAARAAAERLKEWPEFRLGPAHEGARFQVEPATDQFLPIEGISPKGEGPEPLRFQRVISTGTRPIEIEERKSPIVVLGDSFVQMHRILDSDFATHLYRFTGHKLDIVAPLSGAEKSCREALRMREDDLAGKRIVIWLLCEQQLRPCDQWPRIAVFLK